MQQLSPVHFGYMDSVQVSRRLLRAVVYISVSKPSVCHWLVIFLEKILWCFIFIILHIQISQVAFNNPDFNFNQESFVSSAMSTVPGVLNIQAYSDRIENEEREMLVKYISVLEDKNHKKEIWWQTNKNNNGTKFDSKNLKSNLKRNNVFIKKLKQFSSEQLETALKDINNLNLSKYLSEIIEALIHCKLKVSDISAAVKVSSELHLIYSDFASDYLEYWKKYLDLYENSPVFNRHKYKVDLILFCELIISGIFHNKESLDILYNTLCSLVRADLTAHKNIDIIFNFCKYCGEDFVGAVPRNIRILSNKYNIEVPSGRLISPNFQVKVKNLLKEYYDSLSLSLKHTFEIISTLEKRYNDHLLEKGDVHPDKLKQLESFKKEFAALNYYTDKISDLVDFTKPLLKKTACENLCSDIQGMTREQLIFEVWGDEATEKFYNELPNVEEYLLLTSKDSDPDFELNVYQQVTEETLNEEISADEFVTEVFNQDEEEWNDKADKDEDKATAQLHVFLNNLSSCLNQYMIDTCAIEFLITYDSKQARNKLVEYFYALPRTRYDLFPFICRFLAIVNQVHPDIAKKIADKYYKQFRYLIVKKDQIRLENKIKNVKIISELLKFKLFSSIYGLFCLKLLLNDFSHHHIEMACVFLENCGKYLYFSPENHFRTKSYLEQMLVRKNNVILDLKYKNMIDSIYHLIIPMKEVNVSPSVRKARPVVHEFIRHVIYTKLDQDTLVLAQDLIEKLNWNDVKTERYIIKCLSNPNNIKFDKINIMAKLVQSLSEEYEEQMIQVVDNVLEDIRLGLEVMDKAMSQRRIAMVAYLGELYIHCDLVEKDTIITTLYSIITHLVDLEPADDLSRVVLVLTLLDTCCNYFPHSVLQKELRYFIIYFQNYFLYKSQRWDTQSSRFPILLLQQRYEETIHKLYPNMKLFHCLDESMSAVQKIFLDISQKYNLNLGKMNCLISNHIQDSPCEAISNNVEHTEEGDALAEAYDQLVSNSMKRRADVSVNSHLKDITIPVIKKPQNEMETQFFMLIRKANHKPMLKEISVPSDSEIVTTFKSSQKSWEDEMYHVKQITLRYNKRIQQESE
ncbi:regulator of nonsense transcripts 2-like [Diaphorina citri]|jgi:MIF4G domain.|uniref:Regulator of nonsense transcripts 2-like n=1 Tax=Diaphorina citri TaxID=121845 RepID=A0A3Q0ISA5_DIACI|nr:regulator of nonsense transcripts 2-like [Diaphorina citri]